MWPRTQILSYNRQNFTIDSFVHFLLRLFQGGLLLYKNSGVVMIGEGYTLVK